MTIIIHANRTLLEAHGKEYPFRQGSYFVRVIRNIFVGSILEFSGFYKNTPMDKMLNFDVDINGLKHIEWILELHVRHDKKATVYTPKLYLAITSKPVAELSGNSTVSQT